MERARRGDAKPHARVREAPSRPRARHPQVWQGHRRLIPGSRILLDLFSGCGKVGSAGRRMGFTSLQFDTILRADDDLTKPLAQRRIKSLVMTNRVAACMLPVPCTSFTTARNRTSVIRSTQEPWGISREMNEREARSIALGNATAGAALKIIRLLNKYKVPWIVENPRTSYLWHLPELHAVSQAAHGHFRVADFCQFGARWRKKTGFLCGNIDELDSQPLCRTCSGKALCSSTNKPHIVLSGNNKQGIPWTKIAEPYPTRLASMLAKVLLCNEFAQHTYNKVRVCSPPPHPT